VKEDPGTNKLICFRRSRTSFGIFSRCNLGFALFAVGIGALLLTPVTLDRPFFTELAARSGDTINLTDTGGWGEVYAGLVTRRLPASFPLNMPPQKLTENMVLLVNPQTVMRRGN